MHPCNRLSLLVALFTALLTTTHVNAQQIDPLDGSPQWVKDAMAQESRKPKLRTVKTSDGTFRTKMPGKAAEPQAIEDGWYFQSDIKAGSPLECYIFTTAMDLASLTNLIAESNINAVGTNNNGTIGNRRVFDTEAGSIDGIPYLALEWSFTISNDAQTMIGFTKARAAAIGDMAFACAHNYLGYRETFANAFSAFVANMKYEDSTPPPYYEEIALLDINGIGSGVAHAEFSTDEGGDKKMYATEATIMPVDAGTLLTSDSITITYTTPAGELIKTVNVSVENGEIVSNMTLQRNDAGDWVSSGTKQGKPLEVELDGALSPTSELGQMAITRELLAGTETSASMDVWVPGADPTRFLESRIVRDDAEEKGQANVTLGPISYAGKFDDYGNMIDAEMVVGPVTINIDRIWSRGSLTE